MQRPLFLNGCRDMCMRSFEKLGLNTRVGRLKANGAIFCVAGALIASLYVGKAFFLFQAF